jgi:eukaryotic-like serine/threonine-protein kinase
MQPTQRSQLESIFLAALELPRAEQEAFLARECAATPELLPMLRELLIQDRSASAGAGWSGPAWSAAALRFGPYRVTGRLGSGGMGVVYSAVRDDDEFQKRVAIKTIPRGLLTEIGAQRLRHERQILAQLDHPNIARLLDGGTTEERLPYVVMEHVDGEPITRYAESRNLSVAGRLRLFRQLLEAVQFAHSNLVLHRDLKPANILVTQDGTVKLLDFGIARILDSLGDASFTVAAMTPEYASPEQLRSAALSTASDVYSLGVLLYQLLAGALPNRDANAPPEFPRETARHIGSDLENIVLKALRKEPELRYASAEQFAEDLRRHAEGLPVLARQGTFSYYAAKFVRRNKVAVISAAALALTLVGGIWSTTTQRDRAERLRVRAEKVEAATRQLLYAAQMNLAFQAWDAADVGNVPDLLEAQRPRAGEEDLRGFEWDLLRGLVNGGSRILRGPAEIAHLVVFSHDGANVAMVSREGKLLILDTATGNVLQSFAVGLSYDAVFSPDGKWIAAGIGKGLERIWSWRDGRILRTLNAHTEDIWTSAISPDGRTLAIGSMEGPVTLWDFDSGRPIGTFKGHQGGVASVAFSPDGKILATASVDHTAKLWDVASGRTIATLGGYNWYVLSVAFSPDGATLATSGSSGEIKLWDVASHHEIAVIQGDGSTVSTVKFSPDGRMLAFGDASNRVKLYRMPSRELEATLRGHTALVQSVAFSPDSKTLVSGSLDRTVRLWDVTRRGGEQMLDAHKDWVWGLSFSPDGKRLASAGKDGAVRLWQVSDGRALLTLKHPQWVNSVVFSPDGSKLATAADDGWVRLWDSTSGQVLAAPGRHSAVAECVAFSPNGRILASGSKTGEIKLWDTSGGGAIGDLLSANHNIIWGIAFSPDGRYLAAAEGGLDDLEIETGHLVTIWDVATRQPVKTLASHSQDVRAVAFSSDGRLFATGSYDNTIKLWDAGTFREIATLKSHKVQSLAFLPDGRRLVSGGQDNAVKLWNVTTLEQVGSLSLPSVVNAVAVSPREQVLAAGSNDGKVRLWAPAADRQ